MAQRYELPNGKFIEVDEDFVGSQDEKDLLDTFNAREQQQGTETSQSTQSDTVVPDGKENNWIYDNVVVAPYEGTRKFINSSGRLIEDLGDTLGEATNFYGLALGDKAENGLVELVSKKTAKERGLKDPIFGESDKRDFYNGGIKGFFYDPAHPENDDHTTSLTGSFVESGVQFLLGYATAGRILNKFGAVTPTTKLEKFVDATTKGAIGDFLAFDENSGRFADVVTHYAPDFGNTYLSYLQTNKDDTWYEGRLKNSLEGMGLGLIAEVIFKVAKSSKNFASKTLDEADFKADQQVIAKSQEAILSVKDKLDEAKTIGEKMKIVNDALEDVDGLKPAPKIISKEEKVVLLNKIAQEDLLVNYERWKAGEMSAEEAFSIPRAWINLDTIDKSLTTSDFIKTTVSIVDAVKNSYPQVEKKFSDEVIKRKAILEYGGDLNKVFQDFSDLTKVFKEKDIAPLIYQHEVTLNSLVNMLAPMVRQSKMGLRPQAEVDTLIDLIGAMQNNRKIIASEFGGGLNTFGKTKEEFLKANILEENFRRAIGEFQNFSAKDPEAKAKLLDKLSALDRPDVSRRILNFVFSNRIWDITNEVWVNALLSNPKTFAINAVSNAITAIARPIEDALGAKLSIYLDGENLTKKAIYEGQIREAKSTLAGLGTYLQEATKYMGSALKNGELILESSSKADTTRNFTGTGLTGKIIRTPTRILNATDEFFKQINYRAKLSSLAVQAGEAKGYKGKDLEEFIAEYIRQGFDEKGLRGTNLEALRYAQENTFTNELTGFSKKFQDAIQTYPVLKQFFPFVRTPFQLAKAIADRTVGGVTYNLDHLLGKSGDPKMIAKVRGQTAMGGILLTSATLLSELGMLSSSTNQNAGYLAGKGDGKALDKFDDAELVRLKKSETNFKPYSFNIGNVQIPFGRLDPYGAFFGIVADYSTNKQRFTQAEIERIGADMQLFLAGQMESSPISMADMTGIRIASAYGALKDNILNKTYFQAIHDIVEAVNDKDSNKLQKYFTNKVGSILVPNIVSKIVNDPYLRDAQGIIDEVIGKRLGLGTPPSPKYNFMGEAHTAGDENSITRFYNNFLNPVPVGTKTDDPVANEILRLGKAPEVLKKFQDGVDYTQYQFGKLSAYDRVNQLLNSTKIEGMTLKDKLADEIQSEGYKNRTDPIKLAQGIADDGTKYQRINQIYNVYKIKAETLFEAEKANYKNIDNPDRNLFTDIKKQQINQNVIRGSRDTNRLQPLINFYQQ